MKEENIGVLSAGERFGFKGFEWIVLDNNVDGGVLAIMASAWNNEEYSFDDDGCNNYAKSSLRRKLLNELLPVLGEDNLIPHEVDMVADNGDDRYGTVTDRVFILSCDEYRKYRKHVPLLPKTGNLEHMRTNAEVDFEISPEDMKMLKNFKHIKDYGQSSHFPVYGGKM